MDYLMVSFFIYSFLGWCLEVAAAAIRTEKFVNRGFLNGPLCPVYGVGIVSMTVLLTRWESKELMVLVGAALIGAVLEYGTGYLLERLTNIKWWDYSNQPFHLHGRISLISVAAWGFGGVIFLKVNKIVYGIVPIDTIPEYLQWGHVVLTILTVFLVIDMIASFLTVHSLQNRFKKINAMASAIRLLSLKIGNWIYCSTYARMKQEARKKQIRQMRKFYRKERKQRVLKYLQKRMIKAAPDMAPDEEYVERMEKNLKRKKRRLFRRIMLSRVLWTGLCLIVQIIWIFVSLTYFAGRSNQISVALTILSRLISLYVVTKNENSAYKIGWIVIIMFLPVFGGLLYLVFGNKNPSRSLRIQIERVHDRVRRVLKQDESVENELKKEDKRTAGRSHYLYKYSDYPVWKNTKTTYFSIGEEMFDDMVKELETAKHYIFLEFFIIGEGIFWDTVREILVRKAKQGVDVRLIYDDIGCLMLLPKKYREELEKEGIRCVAFNPFKPILSLVMNNRDHRKIMVIDGHTAYTGGINLADEYINVIERFGHWKDTGIKLKGDGVVNFTMMFLEMWNALRKEDDDYRKYFPMPGELEPVEAEGYVQPYGDTPLDDEPIAENIYIDILNQAKDYVYIFTPYLIISDTMRHALCSAAGRGVDVRIVTPGIPDKKLVYRMTRHNYKDLLPAGVRIYEYVPGFIHAKSYVSDDESAVVGSINMDYRSLYLHFECGVYLYRTDSISKIKEDALDTIEKSSEVEMMELRQSLLNRVIDAVLTVMSPLV
ncbi:MAG: cardiolipin synthase [Lachnospiraceae bacterium]|nr:cardiolipin synthase [Lachnospiraceae bacterium]